MVICIAIVLPALMLGTVHSEPLGVTLLLAAALFISLAFQTPIKLDLGGALFISLIAVTALQLLPLPAAVIHIFSPESFLIQQRAANALGAASPSWMTLSVDTPRTTEELAKLFFYLSLYWGIKSVAKLRGTDYVLHAVTTAGVLGAVILLGHKIAMLDKVYGIYTPEQLRFENNISAPFINANHMAGFLSLCSFVSIGLAMHTTERSKRMILIAFSAIIGGALLLTLSRGGIAAYVAGQLLFITMVIVRNAQQQKNRGNESYGLAWVPLGLAFSLLLGMLAAQDAIIGEYISQDTKKIEIFSESLPLLQKFPVTGAGRGAFEMVFPLVSDWASRVTFTRAENILIQLLVDYGIPFGALIMLGFIVLVARAMLSASIRPATAAVIAALIAGAIHNLVDFNWEIPGVAGVAVALLATLTTAKRRSPMKHPGWRLPLGKPVQLGLGAVALLLATLLFAYLPQRDVEHMQRRAQEELSHTHSAFFTANALANMLREHPADAYLPFYAGLYWLRHPGNIAPLPLLAHAVEQNPHAGAPHYYIGRLLLDNGYREQAMMEFRLAARNDARFARFGAAALMRLDARFSTWAAWPVTRSDKRLLLEALAGALAELGKDDQARQADRRLLKLKPPTPGALAREAHRLAAEHPEQAQQLTEQLRLMPGHDTNGLLLTADVWMTAKQPDKAVRILEQAPPDMKNDVRYLRQLASLYQAVGNHRSAIETARTLRRQSDSSNARAVAVEFEGDLERAQGNFHSAKAKYKQALAMMPDNIRFLTKLLHSAKQTNDTDTEITTLNRLVQLDPQEPTWRTMLKSHELKIMPPEI